MKRRATELEKLRADIEVYPDAPGTDVIPAWMSAREWVELEALVECYRAIKRPSMMHVAHRKFYMRLRNRGLVLWQWPHPDHGRRFAAVQPSDVAIKLVEALN